MIIDCDSCVMRQIACGDCVVSVLLDIKPAPGKNAELSNADKAAINNLSSVGLVPPLRFVPDSPKQKREENWLNHEKSGEI
jgi:hypothetical protein